MLDVPVVGMTEAALLTACMLGGAIGVIGFGERVLPIYHELIAGYGLAGRIAGWRVLENTAAYQPGDYAPLDAELSAAANDLVEQDGAESDRAHRRRDGRRAGAPAARVPVPLLDGMRCAVRQAEPLARLGAPKPAPGATRRRAGASWSARSIRRARRDARRS